MGALAIWLAAAFFRNVAEIGPLPRRALGQHTICDQLKETRHGIGCHQKALDVAGMALALLAGLVYELFGYHMSGVGDLPAS